MKIIIYFLHISNHIINIGIKHKNLKDFYIHYLLNIKNINSNHIIMYDEENSYEEWINSIFKKC